MPPSLPQGFQLEEAARGPHKAGSAAAPVGAGDRLKAPAEVLTRAGIITQIKEPLVFSGRFRPVRRAKEPPGPLAALLSVKSRPGIEAQIRLTLDPGSGPCLVGLTSLSSRRLGLLVSRNRFAVRSIKKTSLGAPTALH